MSLVSLQNTTKEEQRLERLAEGDRKRKAFAARGTARIDYMLRQKKIKTLDRGKLRDAKIAHSASEPFVVRPTATTQSSFCVPKWSVGTPIVLNVDAMTQALGDASMSTKPVVPDPFGVNRLDTSLMNAAATGDAASAFLQVARYNAQEQMNHREYVRRERIEHERKYNALTLMQDPSLDFQRNIDARRLDLLPVQLEQQLEIEVRRVIERTLQVNSHSRFRSVTAIAEEMYQVLQEFDGNTDQLSYMKRLDAIVNGAGDVVRRSAPTGGSGVLLHYPCVSQWEFGPEPICSCVAVAAAQLFLWSKKMSPEPILYLWSHVDWSVQLERGRLAYAQWHANDRDPESGTNLVECFNAAKATPAIDKWFEQDEVFGTIKAGARQIEGAMNGVVQLFEELRNRGEAAAAVTISRSSFAVAYCSDVLWLFDSHGIHAPKMSTLARFSDCATAARFVIESFYKPESSVMNMDESELIERIQFSALCLQFK